MLRKFLLIIAIFILVMPSCKAEGGGSSDDVTRIKAEVKLPPEPTDVEANQTIIGVDVNGNGVRDDLEHEIYRAAPTNSAEDVLARKVYYRWSQIITEMLQIYEDHGSSVEIVKADIPAQERLFELDRELYLIFACLRNGQVKKVISGFEIYVDYGYSDRIMALGEVETILNLVRFPTSTREKCQKYLSKI